MRSIFCLFLLLPFALFSQNPEPSGKWSFGLIVSPDYGFRSLKEDESLQYILDARNKSELPAMGFTAGVAALYQLSPRLNLESGIKLSDKAMKTKYISLLLEDLIDGGQAKFSYNDYFLSLPLKANFQVVRGKMGVNVGAGLSLDYLVFRHTKEWLEMNDGSSEIVKSNSTPEKRMVSVSGIGSLGLSYFLTDRLMLRSEVYYQNSLTPIYNTPVKEYRYCGGLQLGIFCKPW